MKETDLWEHLKPELRKLGKFQKISDRFTPGVPDVVGCWEGIPYAIELKRFYGVNTLKLKFRPGQLDWLEDWVDSGGVGIILASLGSTRVVGFAPWLGPQLEEGVNPDWVQKNNLINFLKLPKIKWLELAKQIVEVDYEKVKKGKEG